MLIKGNSHSFSVDVATYLKSAEKALLLQHFYYWYERRKYDTLWIKDGKPGWSYCTYEELHKIFPYMTERSIRYYLKILFEEGFLIKGKYSYGHKNGTTWYNLGEKGLQLYENVPDKSVNADVFSEKAPDKSVNAPDKSVNAPDKSVNAPDKSVNAPDKSVNAPDKSVNAPDKSVNALILKPDKSVNANNILSNSDNITNTQQAEKSVDESNINKDKETKSPVQKKSKEGLPTYWVEFNDWFVNKFCTAYPKKLRTNKIYDGLKEFRNDHIDYTKEDLITVCKKIIKNTPVYLKYTEPKYVKSPVNYLLDMKWDEELDSYKSKDPTFGQVSGSTITAPISKKHIY